VIKNILLIAGLLQISIANADHAILAQAHHVATLIGLTQGEGRILKVDIIKNNQHKESYHFCAGTQDIVYASHLQLKKGSKPYRTEHLIKFSVCQSDALANCEEFATDKYVTFRNKKTGVLEYDISKVNIDMTKIQDHFPSCKPNLFKVRMAATGSATVEQ
jgi:hypothetical protein